ncbi:MAG: DUF6492 family protein [Vicinamibacterales bacterium]
MDLTLVLALRIDRARRVSDLHRFLALGLPSLHRFFDQSLVRELLVISPDEDVPAIAAALKRHCRYPHRVVSDGTLLPLLRQVRGWHKQQIAKLAVSALITTPWYLTLDADVVCVRPMDEAFLFPAGRAIWQHETVSEHPEWWAGSAQVLGSSRVLRPDQPVIGVTPALLHRDSVSELVDRLTRRYAQVPWTTALMSAVSTQWSEYSLYWLHVLDSGRAERLYSDVPRVLYTSDDSVWVAEHLKSRDGTWLDRVFDASRGHAFFVFQSNLEMPLSVPVQLLCPRLGLPAPPLLERLTWAAHHVGSRLRSAKRRVFRFSEVVQR